MVNRDLLLKRAEELFDAGAVERVLGWTNGEFSYDQSPAVFSNKEDLANFVYDAFCGANLSKYLIEQTRQKKKTAVFLKGCDTFSFNQLLNEKRINRDFVKPIVIGCEGKLDINKIKEKVEGVIENVSVEGNTVTIKTLDGTYTFDDKREFMLEKCLSCRGIAEVEDAEEIDVEHQFVSDGDRFSMVHKLENMTEDERFAFWQAELSKCIRCNACRNVCPACSCVKCVFDNDQSGVWTKAPADSFEEQLFHIIRAFHVAGRCTDCGECSRVCPSHIPLHLLNRKFIKDSNSLYGEYQAGVETDAVHPLIKYTEQDLDPTKAVAKTEGSNE